MKCPANHYHNCFDGCKKMPDYSDVFMDMKLSHYCFKCKDRYWDSQMIHND